MVHLLSFIEQSAVRNQWQFSGQSGWQNKNDNALIKGLTISIYRCPSTVLPEVNPYSTTLPGSGGVGIMYTTYVAIGGGSHDAGVRTYAPNPLTTQGATDQQHQARARER